MTVEQNAREYLAKQGRSQEHIDETVKRLRTITGKMLDREMCEEEAAAMCEFWDRMYALPKPVADVLAKTIVGNTVAKN